MNTNTPDGLETTPCPRCRGIGDHAGSWCFRCAGVGYRKKMLGDLAPEPIDVGQVDVRLVMDPNGVFYARCPDSISRWAFGIAPTRRGALEALATNLRMRGMTGTLKVASVGNSIHPHQPPDFEGMRKAHAEDRKRTAAMRSGMRTYSSVVETPHREAL